MNNEYTVLKEEHKRDLFNLNIRPGLSLSSLSINNNISNQRDVDFGNKLNIRMGVELEFVLPYNKNKWALLVEPVYQYYNLEKRINHNYSEIVNVNYKSFEINAGLRHYLYLNDKSKFFITCKYVIALPQDSKINFEYSNDLNLSRSTNINCGLGYKYDKYSFELCYGFKRELLEYSQWTSNYNLISLVVAYSLF